MLSCVLALSVHGYGCVNVHRVIYLSKRSLYIPVCVQVRLGACTCVDVASVDVVCVCVYE